MMLQCVIVKCVASLNLMRMLRTDSFERQDLHRTYLAHHELESVVAVTSIIVVIEDYTRVVVFDNTCCHCC